MERFFIKIGYAIMCDPNEICSLTDICDQNMKRCIFKARYVIKKRCVRKMIYVIMKRCVMNKICVIKMKYVILKIYVSKMR